MAHPFFSGLQPTLHISHRGGAGLAPEHTVAAFDLALRVHRTDVFEVDVQPTRDGELVVLHDESLDRCTDGRGLVRDHTLAQLRALDAGHSFSVDGGSTFPFRGRGLGILTLDELLRGWPSVRLNIELKPTASGYEAQFARQLRAEDAVRRVCVGSEADSMAAALHDALPEACHFYPRDALTAFVLAAHMGDAIPRDERFEVLDMPLHHQGMRLITPAFLDIARQQGKWVNVWTIDDEGDMRALLSDGVGGIMTDRPDLLRQAMNA